jgi:hypothetical protein
LYQQFHHWALLLQDKIYTAQAQGDPTAKETLDVTQQTLQACQDGARGHGIPLCGTQTLLLYSA